MTHTIYFSGHIVAGQQQAVVAERLRERMRLTPEQVSQLFSGQRVAVKRGLDAGQAQRFADGLAALGAVVEIEPPLQDNALSLAPIEPRAPHSEAAALDPYLQPTSSHDRPANQCRRCGAVMPPQAVHCHLCGADQRPGVEKNRFVAALLALLFGWIGGHRLYLGQWWGVLYLLLYPIMWPVSLVEALVFVFTPAERWRLKYGNVRSGSGVVVAVACLAGAIPIIGILAAVAIPAYQDYVLRSHVHNAMNEGRPYRDEVEAMIQRTGFLPAANLDAGLDDDIQGQHMAYLKVIDGGGVVLKFSEPRLSDYDLVWYPQLQDGTVTWDCTGGSLPNKYRPSACRAAGNTATASASADGKVFRSADRLDALTLSNAWEPMEMPGASLSFVHPQHDIGIAVLREAREQFDASLTLEDYKQLLVEYSFADFGDLEIEEMGYQEIDGRPALLFTVTGSSNGVRIKALVAAVESHDSFYKVTSWTSLLNFAKHRDQITAAVTSLRITPSGNS